MPITLEQKERAVGDDYPMAIDLSAVDVFSSNNVTSATVTATASSGTAPTLGAVSFPTANVPTFRVSGGTAGECVITVTATNAATPPNVIVRACPLRTV